MNCQTSTRPTESRHIPPGLLLQWHVTERCNLRCSHCYQSTYAGKELGFRNLLTILGQYTDLLGDWRDRAHGKRVRGHITVTGGEPFVRKDFPDLLEVFAANAEHFSFAVLTNGSFIDAPMAKRLARLGPAFVQVSLDGARATHDRIRGPGHFDRVVAAVKHLVLERVRTFISFTAHRGNFREFSQVARLGRKLKVDRVWADRMIPSGSGDAIREQVLNPAETREFFALMRSARRRAKRAWFGRTVIAMQRALQFLEAGGRPYHCTAGDSLVTVQPNGDLLPCRRMPIRVGNLLETPLAELYYQSELFRALRRPEQISDGCESCSHSSLCRGGLKCLSYAATGDPFRADPGCWLASPGDEVAGIGRSSCGNPLEMNPA